MALLYALHVCMKQKVMSRPITFYYFVKDLASGTPQVQANVLNCGSACKIELKKRAVNEGQACGIWLHMPEEWVTFIPKGCDHLTE